MSGKGLFALTVVLTGSAWAQAVISAHSGVIQYTEGEVKLDGTTVVPKFAQFPDVKEGQTLAAEDGRAEVLLTPGVFLRIAENSSFKMVSNKLATTKVEAVTGSMLVEVAELLPDNAITLAYGDAEIALIKKGLYRVDADANRLRVFDGEARVTSGSNTVVAKRGREVQFGAVLEARSFDTKQTDAFFRWSARRTEYVAQANVVSAKTSGSSFTSGGSGFGLGRPAGSWAWNPWYGLFTFVPGGGIYNSPFGYSFFSPATVVYLYTPRPAFYPAPNLPTFMGNGSSPMGMSNSSAASAAPMSMGRAAPSAGGGAVSAGGMRGGAHH